MGSTYYNVSNQHITGTEGPKLFYEEEKERGSDFGSYGTSTLYRTPIKGISATGWSSYVLFYTGANVTTRTTVKELVHNGKMFLISAVDSTGAEIVIDPTVKKLKEELEKAHGQLNLLRIVKPKITEQDVRNLDISTLRTAILDHDKHLQTVIKDLQMQTAMASDDALTAKQEAAAAKKLAVAATEEVAAAKQLAASSQKDAPVARRVAETAAKQRSDADTKHKLIVERVIGILQEL